MSTGAHQQDIAPRDENIESRIDRDRDAFPGPRGVVFNVAKPNSGRRIDLLEVIDDKTIVVSWQSPTGGRYGHQTWIRTSAPHAGVCAISGLPISRRQEVFRPKVIAGRRPGNWDEMILASAARRFQNIDD